MGDSQVDFNRFIKNFSTRLIQAVVQSRLGRPVETQCSAPTDEKDWFSFKVDELGEVAAYIRQSLQRFPPTIDRFTLEFILYTAGGDYLPLEEWQVSVDKDEKDPTVSMSNLYHQIGILLRSCTIAARMTPLSRHYVKKQSPDSFVVLYRILDSEGSANPSNEEYVMRQLGKLPSPYGTLSLQLFYKLKVETQPRKSESPSGSAARPSSFASAIPVEGSDRKETTSTTPVSEHLQVFRGSPATPQSARAHSTGVSEERRADDSSVCTSSEEDEAGSSSPFKGACQCHYGLSLPNTTENSPTSGRRRNSSFPFAVLLSSSKCKCTLEKIHSPPVEPTLVEEEKAEESHPKSDSEKEAGGKDGEEDSDEEEEGDDSPPDSKFFSSSASTPIAAGAHLGEFLSQCRRAPVDSLHVDAEKSTGTIRAQLADFATHLDEFDHFVKEVEERVEND